MARWNFALPGDRRFGHDYRRTTRVGSPDQPVCKRYSLSSSIDSRRRKPQRAFRTRHGMDGHLDFIFMLVVACFDMCAIVIRSCTRFTQEIFMVFVSAIFIFEGRKGIGSYFDSEKETYSTETWALFSLIFLAVTLQLGLFFGKVRSSLFFLLGPLRELTADFGIAFAIVTACLLAWVSRSRWSTKSCYLPNIKPSDEARSQY